MRKHAPLDVLLPEEASRLYDCVSSVRDDVHFFRLLFYARHEQFTRPVGHIWTSSNVTDLFQQLVTLRIEFA